MDSRLNGKVALVSGGARGLGAAHVELFAEHGAQVVFGDIRDAEGRLLEQKRRDRGLPASYVHLDVTSVDEWHAAVKATLAEFGSLTTLVNNAGIFTSRGLEEADDDEWARILAVNLEGQWHGMRAAMPALTSAGVRHGASIVNISSIYGVVGSPSSTAYHASKGGVRMLTKAVAVEYGPRGVRVNAVNPGFMETEFAGAEFTPEKQAEALRGVPLGRSAPAREIAYASLYLASDEASYVTGAEIMVDGGWTLA